MGSFGRRTRVLLGGATAVGVSVAMVLPASSFASATTPTLPASHLLPSHPSQGVYDVGLNHSVTPAMVDAATASTKFTQFKSTITVGGHTYPYTMAGKNPAKKVTNPAAKIKAFLVPVVIVYPGGSTWDPTVADSCDSGATALARTQQSPIFVSQSWTWGGTSIGSGQVTDAFQRANFWTDAKPTGVNPTYGVTLTVKTLPKVTINVPSADAYYYNFGCGTGKVADININWLDSYMQGTVIPSLAGQGVNASTLPIFLLHNSVEFTNNNPNDCCVLGYHTAYTTTSSTLQTYALSMYDNSGFFTGTSDITALSHEVAEWMDDPYVNNATPAWGHIGQVTGCQANLEVGDPVSGTTFTDTVGGFTYHPQELAFFSWFFGQTPSLGVNGWYSDQGKFTAPAAACT